MTRKYDAIYTETHFADMLNKNVGDGVSILCILLGNDREIVDGISIVIGQIFKRSLVVLCHLFCGLSARHNGRVIPREVMEICEAS